MPCLWYYKYSIFWRFLKSKWYDDLKIYGEKYNILTDVGNKSDCYENEAVTEKEGREYANSIGAIFMLVSAKNGDNIELLFDTLVRQYLCLSSIKKFKKWNKKKEISKKLQEKMQLIKKKTKKCC